MSSVISASTTSSTALTLSGDTSGQLEIKTGSTPSTAVTIDTSQNVGIGTSSPGAKLSLTSTGNTTADGVRLTFGSEARPHNIYSDLLTGRDLLIAPWRAVTLKAGSGTTEGEVRLQSYESTIISTGSSYTERMRIQSNGNVLIGKTASSGATVGIELTPSASDNYIFVTNNASSACLYLNREGSDGTLVIFRQASTDEGSISVSGTTVSYNGGHLSRWAQTTAPKDDTLLKGTVLSNLDEMNVYVDAEGNLVANEQLNKVKVSDVEGDVNVAGVFVNWSHDEQHNVDEINMAMTGDMIIRIAQGVVVQRGDLLMSAGDGTAKPQGDDIVRSKTIAKITSNHVTCTYEDGSYCVPCVLMAC